MLQQWVLATLVLPALCTLQSWPAWKTKYNTLIASKSAFELNLINERIEGSTAPTDSDEQELWSWYSQVSAGTEKTEAKALMDKTFTDLGGTSSMITDFISQVAVHYNANADPGPAYTAVYQKITEPNLGSGDAMYALHQQYHAMTAEQKQSVASSLVSPLAAKWDTAFQADHANWPSTYALQTDYILKIMDGASTPAGAAPTAGHGLKCYTAYKAASDNKDKTTMGVFDRKMAAKLAAILV